MGFYDNFIRLCAEKGKSPSAVVLDIGIKKSNVTYWKNNRNNPSDVTLAKLSEYFGVSVSDLTGEQKEKPSAENGEEQALSDIELLIAYRQADEVTRELIRRALGLQ